MGVFLRNKIVNWCVIVMALAFSSVLFAANHDPEQTSSLPLIDGYYPAYPPTKARDAQQEKCSTLRHYTACIIILLAVLKLDQQARSIHRNKKKLNHISF